VIIAVAGSTSLVGAAADSRTSTTANDLVPVYALPDQVFIGKVDADASAVTIGDQVDLVGTTGAMMIDVGASTTDVFTFLGILPDQTTDEAEAYAMVRITHGKHDAQ
jgi:hypothetical protein